MPLISSADQERLSAEFAAMSRRVTLLFFTQTVGCETCLMARQIIDELPALSDKIAIEEVNLILERERAQQYGIDRVPSIAVLTEDENGQPRDTRMRFLGPPSGYEFVALVRAVMLAGGAESGLSQHARERLSAVDRPMTIRVFSTPTCPYCPRAVTLAHEMAWANPNITTYAVEATEYPDLARQYHVTGVPKTVVDDTVEILGALPEDEFIEQALSGLTGSSDAGGAV